MVRVLGLGCLLLAGCIQKSERVELSLIAPGELYLQSDGERIVATSCRAQVFGLGKSPSAQEALDAAAEKTGPDRVLTNGTLSRTLANNGVTARHCLSAEGLAVPAASLTTLEAAPPPAPPVEETPIADAPVDEAAAAEAALSEAPEEEAPPTASAADETPPPEGETP